MTYITISGKLLEERDDAIQIRVEPNWDVWLPRSSINPKGGLRIKRATGEVSADVDNRFVALKVSRGNLPPMNAAHERARTEHLQSIDVPRDLEATDERFARKGQHKT